TLAELAGYSAVILENVTAGQVGTGTLNNLAPWVRETGGGLALTGGRNAYGPGGYFRSPLDPLLPVSMELRREHRKLRLAIVVALDRSGSMNAPAGAGRTKMDLANLGTVQVLDLLSDEDEIGVLAVDTIAHEIVGITEAGAARAHRGRILGIASTGGGIFVYTALQEATRMLLRAKAGTRHVVLFADAADSEEPGQYIQLLEKCRQAGITVSVVGLGTERDVDAEFLKDIARRGEGRCFFTADANEIPRLFAQDTFAVARSTFVQDPTPVAVTGELATLLADPPGQPPPLGGFNLCYARPKATVAVRTEDEYKAPVVASWQAGLGRVLCFAGEADGEYSGEFARWDGIGAFHTGLARWTAGSRGELPDQMLATQEVRDGALLVELHLDPERQGQPFLAPPTLRLLRGTPGGIPASESVDLEWQDADTLAARILLRGDETVLPSLLLPDLPPHTLAPVCLPYSPEFRHLDPRRGRETLARLAAVTGGGECLDLAEVWTQLPRHPRDLPLAPWLYSLALLAFLLGIFHRRTGMLARLALPRLAHRTTGAAAKPPKPRRRTRKNPRATPDKTGPPPEPEAKPTPPPPTPADDTLTAMREARQRASRRTRRH
ncbi:MAG: vWA domain-containing protein, partial [Lentisphaeria bacterium]|nr:vWA domain-containing protein [Lentisphaeria bacterium]